MAARKDLRHSDEVRAKIQTSQLINRLQDNAEGKIELTPVQQKSIEILLKKSLPDLSSVTIGGDPDNPLQIMNGAKETLESKFARAISAGREEGITGKPH